MVKTVYGTPGTGNGPGGRSFTTLGDDIADRVQWVSNEFEARGKSFTMTEGWRPVGVPSDQYATRERDTASGVSTQWYQWGRMKRGETPEAAYPGSSEHGDTDWGKGAIDCSVQDMDLRSSLMGVVGLFRTVPSESWHFAIRRNPEGWWDRSKVKSPVEKAPTPSPIPARPSIPEITLDFQEEAMYVVFVADLGNYLITPTFVRKIVDLPHASTKDTIAGIEKLSKPLKVLPFGEFYGIWSNINAGNKDDSATGKEIQALAKQLADSK